ncbi:MAG TPA: hypothetical protein VK211_09880 [Kamptonema sp.]|nr:hypothetical protein [Kamptonema sp.]
MEMGNREGKIGQKVWGICLREPDARRLQTLDNSGDLIPILHTPFATTALLDTF